MMIKLGYFMGISRPYHGIVFISHRTISRGYDMDGFSWGMLEILYAKQHFERYKRRVFPQVGISCGCHGNMLWEYHFQQFAK
jgi:hypothetical protein